MKVAILVDAQSVDVGKTIKDSLTFQTIPATIIKITEAWRNEPHRRIEALFRDITHCIFVITDAVLEHSTWLPFFIGYAGGKSKHIALYRMCNHCHLPPWLQGFSVFDTEGELSLFFEAEKEEWYVQEKRTRARMTLLEKGISWHTDSFIRSIEENDAEAVELFIDSGFHPDVRDKHGVPALSIAVRKKHAEIVKILLAHGASIDIQSEDRGYSPLMDAVQVKDRNIVQILLANGANPNLTSKDGQTALIIAVGADSFYCVELLVQHHANPDIADKLGMSARSYAMLFKKQQYLELFESCSE